MKRNVYQVALPAAFVVIVLVAFLFIIILANANISFSDSSKNKPSVIAEIPAAESPAAQQELLDYIALLMRENTNDRDELSRERTENARAMNSVYQMKRSSHITEAHLDQRKRFIRSFEEFYVHISDEEKNSIDKILQTRIYEE
jgi:hypothetical protein